jgi:hypothetical protein
MPRNDHFMPRNNGNRYESIPRNFFGTKFRSQLYLEGASVPAVLARAAHSAQVRAFGNFSCCGGGRGGSIPTLTGQSCVGNLSPAMGARNQVGLGLTYQLAKLRSLATQFQTRFLESIPRPIAGLKFSSVLKEPPHPVLYIALVCTQNSIITQIT